MKKLASAVIFLLFFSVQSICQNLVPTQEVLFPQFAVGGGWETDLTLVAQGGDTSAGSILFISQGGQLMPVTVDGVPCSGSLSFSMLYRSSKTYRLTGGSQTQVGWILVSQMIDSSTNGSIGGILTYRFKLDGRVVSQVGVPGAHDVINAHLPFDNTNGRRTGMAIANLLSSNNLTIERYDEQGVFEETKHVPLGALNQTALFVDEMFPASANQRGFLLFKGTSNFGILVLNESNSTIYWGSAAISGVLERQLMITGNPYSMTIRLILDGQFITGVIETSPGVINPITGAIGYPPSGGMIFNLHMNSFLTTTGEAVTAVGTARISDYRMLNVEGNLTYIYEDGSTEDGGTFQIYPLATAQF